MIPSPWVFVVAVLGVYRLVRLIGWDDPPIVARLRAKATGEYVYYNPTENRDGPIHRYTRPKLAHFLACPFCQGFWVSAAAYGVWVAVGSPGAIATHSWTFYALMPFALNAAVALVAKNLDP